MLRPQPRVTAAALVILFLVLAILAAGLLQMHGLAVAFIAAAVITGAVGTRHRWPLRPRARSLAEATLEAMADAVIRFDLDGRLQYLNPAASRMIGLTLEPQAHPPLESAFRLLEREERTPLVPALFEGLRRGHVSGLGNHACLLTNEGLELEVEGQCAPILTGDGRIAGGVLVLRDVTEIREAQRRHLWLEEHDALTGALNRKTLEERLAKAITSQRAADYPMSLLRIELDSHARVTGEEGQAAGDELLLQAFRLIRARIRDSDPVGRLDTAAFGILLSTCPDEAALRIARTVHECLSGYRFQWGEQTHPLEISLGVVHIPPNWETLDRVMAAGESAGALSKASRKVMVHLERQLP